MRLYTSYFANIRKLDKDKYEFVSISRFFPYYMKGQGIGEYLKLAPSADLLSRIKSGEIGDAEYTTEFNAYLDTILAEHVISDLFFTYGLEKDVVLLCYEKTGNFCHRHLVSEWLRKNGYIIEEI